MTKATAISKRVGGSCLAVLMMLLSSASHGAVTSSNTLKVNATIEIGTCIVSLATSDSGSGSLSTSDKGVSIGEVAQPNRLVEGGVTAGINWVKLSLGCQGASNGKKPVVTVNGNALGGSGPGAWLFKGTVNTIDPRVGIVMIDKKIGSAQVPAEGEVALWDTRGYVRPGGKVEFAGISEIREFVMGMSCGDETSCNAQSGQFNNPEGSIQTVMTFTFNYE